MLLCHPDIMQLFTGWQYGMICHLVTGFIAVFGSQDGI